MTNLTIDINPEAINSLDKAKTAIKRLLNSFEEMAKQYQQALEKIQQLEAEITKLKKQSSRPKGSGGKKQKSNYSSGERFRRLLSWKKSSKKDRIEIDREEDFPEVQHCRCGSEKFEVLRTWDKIVQGLIIRRDNVRYKGRDKRCLNCGVTHRSIIPKEINGYEFSSELRSWLSIFKYACRMSEVGIDEFLSDVGIIISSGEINRIILENSNKLGEAYTHLKVWGLKISSYLHTDATSFLRRLKGSGKYIQERLHFVGHEFLSLFVITRRYNAIVIMEKVLGKRAMRKILISDDASCYGKRLLVALKQLCWIHEIRHYLKLAPRVKYHKRQLEGNIGELWDWYWEAKRYKEKATREKRQQIREWFKAITDKQTGYEALDKRLRLTRKKEGRLLLFLEQVGIPIENNLAERDLRPAVVIRKLTGGTKSKEGNRSFERHMSVMQTTRKQGLNIFETVHGLLNGRLHPSVLTAKKLPALAV